MTSKHKSSSLPSSASPSLSRHMLAGLTGGATSTLLFHPLDLVKTRFAVSDGKQNNMTQYKGMKNAFATIVRKEGIAGLYKGVIPNIVAASSGWGFYFLFYKVAKSPLLEHQQRRGEHPGPGVHLIAASTAGVCTLILTNPISVVKTRMCLQYSDEGVKLLPRHKQYGGMMDALFKLIKYEGMSGLYKGFLPGMCGVVHGALQFVSYEELKRLYNNYYGHSVERPLGVHVYLCCAAISKVFSAVVTYPYQVVRMRLQNQHITYNGTLDVIQKTFTHEGLRGFYKGMSPYLVHVTPNVCLVFVIYEAVIHA